MWGVKPFIKRTWNPLGATVLYGEYAQYNDYVRLHRRTSSAVWASVTGIECRQLCASALTLHAHRLGNGSLGLGAVQESTLPRCTCSPAGSIRMPTVDFFGTNVWYHERQPGLRRLRSVPGWWHHLLLSQTRHHK